MMAVSQETYDEKFGSILLGSNVNVVKENIYYLVTKYRIRETNKWYIDSSIYICLIFKKSM